MICKTDQKITWHTHILAHCNTNYSMLCPRPQSLPPSLLTLSYPQFLTHQTLLWWTLRWRCTGLNYWSLFNKAMDCLRNCTGTAVDYIESLLFYILRMSDFCYLHPSTPARRRMAIDFGEDEWEWSRGLKTKRQKGVRGGGRGRNWGARTGDKGQKSKIRDVKR